MCFLLCNFFGANWTQNGSTFHHEKTPPYKFFIMCNHFSFEVIRKIEKLRQEEILIRLRSQVPIERPRIESATAVCKYQTPKRNNFEKQCSVGKMSEFEFSREVEANLETGDLIARHSITNLGSELKFVRIMPGQTEEQRLVITTTKTLPNTMIRSRKGKRK